MEIEDTTSKKDKPESYNDTEKEERLKDTDDDSFIAYFEKFNLRPGNDENCAARKIDAENGRMVEQNEIGDQGEYRARKKMEIDEKTSKEDRSESFNDTGVVDI